jgi:CRISPR-associated endonuclease/helicase Cas3
MELTATPCKREETKADSLFTLTDEERKIPAKLPGKPTEPVHVVWRRQAATKRMELHENDDDKKLAEAMVEVAAGFVDSGRAVLVFARRVEDVEKVVGGLTKLKATVQKLTGTMRGLERDRMADPEAGCPIFARFLRPDLDAKETVYLVCTSAGEVGVNLSADHLVCDLSTFESMAQRFGRVNRFGDRDDTEIHIVHPVEFDVSNEFELRRQRTLALLQTLDGDASPAALGRLDAQARQAAYAPIPAMLEATDILFDSWSLTSLRELPGRPPVEPYLHGVQEQELPETAVAWREEVSMLYDEDVRDRFPAEEISKLLEDYPLKPHELLRDLSSRVFDRLKKLASLPETRAEAPLWLIDNKGAVDISTLGQLLRAGKERLYGKTLVMPPAAGGFENGLMTATPYDEQQAYDVADQLLDEQQRPRRQRIWDTFMLADWWLVRSIDTKPNLEDQGEESESGETPKRYWNFFERAREADSEGSEAVACEVLWDDHTRDVADRIDQIASALPYLQPFARMFRQAGEYHDLGKRRTVWQRNIGNTEKDKLLAKSAGGRALALDLAPDYRHEFGSLADLLREGSEFDLSELSEDERDLLLHVIATHHGRGRPHFPAAEAFDPLPAGIDAAVIAADVARRFARLQRKYGRWGLAYLESILRAADWAASARPTPREAGATP